MSGTARAVAGYHRRMSWLFWIFFIDRKERKKFRLRMDKKQGLSFYSIYALLSLLEAAILRRFIASNLTHQHAKITPAALLANVT